MEVRLGVRGRAHTGPSVAGRDVRFHADDRFYSTLLRQLLKRPGTVQVPVIGYGERRLLQLDRPPHEVLEPVGAIQQRVLGVAMKVYERHFLRICTRALPRDLLSSRP